MSGITRIGGDLVKEIIANRPYTSIEDFISKIKVNKTQVINLIKSGAFDCFGDRVELMHNYVNMISDTKKRVTLQNLKMLIDFNLIPQEYDLQKRVFNFNKYLKKLKKDNIYQMDNVAFNFYSSNFDVDKLINDETESGFSIKQVDWDNIYKKQMDIIRPFVKNNQNELLIAMNNRLTADVWDKYCKGTISKWEMDSVSFYEHEHELKSVNNSIYGFSEFDELPENPEVDRIIPIKGKMIPLFKIVRIAGTVLDRDKAKKTVTLLTKNGVVMVKIYGGVFANYDKQISERGADGKKHVIRKSEFARGNKIIVCGVREGDSFRAKKYSKTPYHLVETIESISEKGIIQTYNRSDEE